MFKFYMRAIANCRKDQLVSVLMAAAECSNIKMDKYNDILHIAVKRSRQC